MNRSRSILVLALLVASIAFAYAGGPTVPPSTSSVTGLGTMAAVNSPTPIANGGTAATTAAAARTNMGLGTMAVATATDYTATGTFADHTNDTSTHGVAQIANAPDHLRLDGTATMTGNLRLGLKWFSNDGDDEGINITSNGCVLIATTTNRSNYILQLAGSIFSNGDIVLGAGNNIRKDTADGSDTGEIHITSGGNSSYSRGGTISMYGNESAIPGCIYYYTGNVTGAGQYWTVGAGSIKLGLISTGFGIGTYTPQYQLTVVGNSWFSADVSALSFTDRTPSPNTLADAYAIVNSHESSNGKVNHTALSPLAYGTKIVRTPTGRKIMSKTMAPGENGMEEKDIEIDEILETEEPDPNGRNLSMVISAQALVIKDLIKRIEALENR